MFTRDGLVRLIRLHEKSYGLFTWLNGALRRGRGSMAAVEASLSFAEAAAEWFRRNQSNIPEDVRPAEDEIDPMSHLFASFLSTSFEMADRSAVRACPGCWCCVYWIESKHLVARNPDKKAISEARQLKILYLQHLAEDAGLPLTEAEADRFYGASRDLWPQVALTTYVRELDRRSKFASQGEGVLALWRDIAWEDGHPRKKFRLKPDEILAAESALRARLEKFAETI